MCPSPCQPKSVGYELLQSGFKLESPVIQNKIVMLTNVLSQNVRLCNISLSREPKGFYSLNMVYDTQVRDIPTIQVKHWTSCGRSVSEAFRNHLLEILQLESSLKRS